MLCARPWKTRLLTSLLSKGGDVWKGNLRAPINPTVASTKAGLDPGKGNRQPTDNHDWVLPPLVIHFCLPASTFRWTRKPYRLWTPQPYVQHIWPHLHNLELEALILAISHWQDRLQITQLAISTETSRWFGVNQKTTHSHSLLQQMFCFFHQASKSHCYGPKTRGLYDDKCFSLNLMARKKHQDPTAASPQLLAEYLLYLCRRWHPKGNTIMTCLVAICFVCSFCPEDQNVTFLNVVL